MPIWSICPICNAYSPNLHKDENDCRENLKQIIMSLAAYRIGHKNFTPRRKDYK